MEKVSENDDVKVRLQLQAKDSQGNLVTLNVSSLVDYHAYVYKMVGLQKKLIATFKKGLTNQYAVIPSQSISNEVSFVFNRTDNRNIAPCKCFAEFKYKVTATSDFINATANGSDNEIPLFEVITSPNNTAMP